MTPRSGLWLCLALALALAAAPAARAEPDEPAALCERAIVNGARRGGVPPEVLHAVALTETGRKQDGRMRPWPWAINREGKGYWFETREEALAFAQASLAAGRPSFDVGCVQINYRWHGHAFPIARGHVRPRMDRDLRGAVPAHPLRGARQLVGGGGGLPFADPGAGAEVPRALRPAAGRARARAR